MALTIQTNMAALEAHRQLGITSAQMDQSLERLSSGYRINHAADDAAGLSMSNKFVAQIDAMGVASQNASQANSLLQIAEGGADQISQILARLKELATQAASANASQNLTDINGEASSLLSEITRIANSTTFQGQSLINGTWGTGAGTGASCNATLVAYEYGFNYSLAQAGTYSVGVAIASAGSVVMTIRNTTTKVQQSLEIATSVGATYNFNALGVSFSTAQGVVNCVFGTAFVAANNGFTICAGTAGGGNTFQIGDANNADNQIQFTLGDMRAVTLSVSTIDLTTQVGAQNAMNNIDNAITTLNSDLASIGASMNRLGYASANLNVATENASAANSAIKDVDMASEMTNFTKNQVLVQAGTAMLAQANASAQTLLTLFK
jgi:flagellin